MRRGRARRSGSGASSASTSSRSTSRREWSSSLRAGESTLESETCRTCPLTTRRSTASLRPGCSTTFLMSTEPSAELSRVLRPGGRLVAVTNYLDHLSRVARAGGLRGSGASRSAARTAPRSSGRHFADVDDPRCGRHDSFPDGDADSVVPSLVDHVREGVDRRCRPREPARRRAGVRSIFVAEKASS